MFRKALVMLAILYAIWPVDAFPDVIPLLGWLDDLGVLGLIVSALLRDIGAHGQRAAAESIAGNG